MTTTSGNRRVAVDERHVDVTFRFQRVTAGCNCRYLGLRSGDDRGVYFPLTQGVRMDHVCVTLDTVARDALGPFLTHIPMWVNELGAAYRTAPRWVAVITRGNGELKALLAEAAGRPDWTAVDFNTYDYSGCPTRSCCTFEVVDFEAQTVAVQATPTVLRLLAS